MIDHNRWRDQQLKGFKGITDSFILSQEKIMLDFVTQFKDVAWRWHGNNTNFKNICQQLITVDSSNCQGVIIFGKSLNQVSTNSLVHKVTTLIKDFDYAYVAINRYEVLTHDLNFELPDRIEDAIDVIIQYCDPRFKRLHTFNEVDGNHMVAAHPMDCYGLCKL